MMDNIDSDDDEFRQIAEVNLMKISSNVTKIGYTDGITEGSQLAFQKGFDAAYQDGLKLGFEIGKFKSLIKEFRKEDNNDLKQELENLDKNIETIDPFRKENLIFLTKNHNNIDKFTKEQNENIDKIIINLETNYPKINEFILRC